MAYKETNILKSIMLRCSRYGSRLFRNNVGVFTTDRGDKIRTGLCPGSSDLIGWTPVIITPDMIGKTIAVFTALEIKTGSGVASDQQKNFIAQVKAAGGRAGLVRSDHQAEDVISGR